MARAARRLSDLVAEGVPADPSQPVAFGGDGAAATSGGRRRPNTRPFLWARGEMGRLADL